MFRFDNCLKEKPDSECVHVSRLTSLILGLAAPLSVSTVCRACAGRVRLLGVFVLLGMAVIVAVLVYAVRHGP